MPKKHRVLDLYPKRSAPSSIESGNVGLYAGEDFFLHFRDEFGVDLPLGVPDAGKARAKSIGEFYSASDSPYLLDGVATEIKFTRSDNSSSDEFPGNIAEPQKIPLKYPGTYLVTVNGYWHDVSANNPTSLDIELSDNALFTYGSAVAESVDNTTHQMSRMFFITVEKETSFTVTATQHDSPDVDFLPSITIGLVPLGPPSPIPEGAGSERVLLNASGDVSTGGTATVTLSEDFSVGDVFSISSGALEFPSYGCYLVIARATAPDQGQTYLDILSEFSGDDVKSLGRGPDTTSPTDAFSVFLCSPEEQTLTFQVTQSGSTGPLPIHLDVSVVQVGRKDKYNSLLDTSGTVLADPNNFNGTPVALEESDISSSRVQLQDAGTKIYFEEEGTYIVLSQLGTNETSDQTYIADQLEALTGNVQLKTGMQSLVPWEFSWWSMSVYLVSAGTLATLNVSHNGTAPINVNVSAAILDVGGPSAIPSSDSIPIPYFYLSEYYPDHNSPNVETLSNFVEWTDHQFKELADIIDGLGGGGGVAPSIVIANAGTANWPFSGAGWLAGQTTVSVSTFVGDDDTINLYTASEDLNASVFVLIESLDVPGNWYAFNGTAYSTLPFDEELVVASYGSGGLRFDLTGNVFTYLQGGNYKITVSVNA